MAAIKPKPAGAPGAPPKKVKSVKKKPPKKPAIKPKPAGAPGAPPKKHKPKPTRKPTPAGRKPGGAPGTPKDIRKGGHKPKATLKKKKPAVRELAKAANKAAVAALRKSPPKPRVRPGPRGEQILREHDRTQERIRRRELLEESMPLGERIARTAAPKNRPGENKFWNDQYNLTLSRLYGAESGAPGLDRYQRLHIDAMNRVNKTFERDFRAFKNMEKVIESGATLKAHKKKTRDRAEQAHAHIVRNKLTGWGNPKLAGGKLLTPEDLRILVLDPEFGWLNNKAQASGKPLSPFRVRVIQNFLISEGHVKLKANGSLAGPNGDKTMSALMFQMRQLRNRERKEAVEEIRETFYQTGIIKEGRLKGFGKVGTARDLFDALTKGYNEYIPRIELGEMLTDLGNASRIYARNQALANIQATAAMQAKRVGADYLEAHRKALARMERLIEENQGNFSKVMGWLDDRTNDIQDIWGSFSGTLMPHANDVRRLSSASLMHRDGVITPISKIVITPKEARLIRDHWEQNHTIWGLMSNFVWDPLNFVPFGLIAGTIAKGVRGLHDVGRMIEQSSKMPGGYLKFGVAKSLQAPLESFRIMDRAIKNYHAGLRGMDLRGAPHSFRRPDYSVYKAGVYATKHAAQAKFTARKSLQIMKRQNYGIVPVVKATARGIRHGHIAAPKVKNNVETLLQTGLKGTKVVNDVGDPLILTQGSKNAFANVGTGTGHVFHEMVPSGEIRHATDEELATSSRLSPEDKIEDVVSSVRNGVYVNITKPFDVSSTASFKTPKGFIGHLTRTFNRKASRGLYNEADLSVYRKYLDKMALKSGPKTIHEMIEAAPDGFFEDYFALEGFDGLVYEADGLRSYVVFDEEKIIPAYPDAAIDDGYLYTDVNDIATAAGIPTKEREQMQELYDYLVKNVDQAMPTFFEFMKEWRYPLFTSDLKDFSGFGRKFNATVQEEIRSWVIQRRAADIAKSVMRQKSDEMFAKNGHVMSNQEATEIYTSVFEGIRAKGGAYNVGQAPPKLQRAIEREQVYIGALFRDHYMPALEQRLRLEYDAVGGVRPIGDIAEDEVEQMIAKLGWTASKKELDMMNPLWRAGSPRPFSINEMMYLKQTELDRFRNHLDGLYGIRQMRGEKIDPRDMDIELAAKQDELDKAWKLQSDFYGGDYAVSHDLWVDNREILKVSEDYVRQYVSKLPQEAIDSLRGAPTGVTNYRAVEALQLETRWKRNTLRSIEGEKAPLDDLHSEADWILKDEQDFIGLFAGPSRDDVAEIVGKASQATHQRGYLRTSIQEEIQAIPGLLGLADTKWLAGYYKHLGQMGNGEMQKFREIIQEKHALSTAIDEKLLPRILAKQFAYWQALQAAQSFPLRQIAIAAHSILAVWRAATLPLRPGWTVANVVDNWLKSVIRGYSDPSYFFQATAGAGKHTKMVWDMVVGGGFEEMEAIVHTFDQVFKTDLLPLVHKVKKLVYEIPGDKLTKLYNARGISLSEEALGAVKLANELENGKWLTKEQYYLDWLRRNGFTPPRGHANPNVKTDEINWLDETKDAGFFVDHKMFDQMKKDLGLPDNLELRVHYRPKEMDGVQGDFDAGVGNNEFRKDLQEYDPEIFAPRAPRINIYVGPKHTVGAVDDFATQKNVRFGTNQANKWVEEYHHALMHELQHAKQHFTYGAKRTSLVETDISRMFPTNEKFDYLEYHNQFIERGARMGATVHHYDYQPVVWPVNAKGVAIGGTSSAEWTGNAVRYALSKGAPEWRVVDEAFRLKAGLKKFYDRSWELMGNKPEMFFRRHIYKHAYADAKRLGKTDSEAVVAGMKAVEDTLFDYSKITLLEQNLFFLAPFVQFFRKNTTFWIKNSVKYPMLPGTLITFENAMAQVHADADPRLQRYLTSGEISDALEHVPGLGWLAKFAGDHNFMLDPIQLFSFAPLYRAFKSENPYLAPENAGMAFIGSLVDSLADWGLMLNPFLRKPLEWTGVLNARSWQSIFPQTSVLQALTREFFNSRFPNGLNVEEWLASETFDKISKAGVEDAADNFNYYVQLEMAAQAHRGEKVDRERAAKTVTDFIYVNTVVGYFFHIYSRRAEPADFYFGQLAQKMKYGVLDFNELPPDLRAKYYLFKNRGWDPVAYDKYVEMLPKIEGYYKMPNWEAAQKYLKENPEIYAWVKKNYRGSKEAANYIHNQIMSAENDEYWDIQAAFKKVGVPYDIKQKFNAAFVTPELEKYWNHNKTPHEKRMKMLQGKVANYYEKMNKTFYALPEGDAREAFMVKHPDLERWWAMNDKDSDDLNIVYRALQQTVRDRLFEYYEKGDFDGALKWIEKHPYVFDHTQSENKYRTIAKTGQWPGWKDFGGGFRDGGGGGARSQHAIDYLKARSALDKYFSLSPAARRKFLASGSKQAEMVLWYFNKYASDSDKPLSAKAKAFLHAKKHLDYYFSLTKEQRRKWLNGNSKGAKIVRNYFRKWVEFNPANESQRSKDFQKAKTALNFYFGLPEDKRYDWLHGGSKMANEALAYFGKYSKPKEQTEHSKDFLAVKDLLTQYFALSPEQRQAFVAKHPELKAYFDKYAVQGGLTQHAEDYLAVKDLLTKYFALPKEQRKAWLNSGTPDANAVLSYFQKYSKQNSVANSWTDGQYHDDFQEYLRASAYRRRLTQHRRYRPRQGTAHSIDPLVNKRLEFWKIYFSLNPDERPSFVLEHGEEYGIFIFGASGEQYVEDEMQEWFQGSYAHGSDSERSQLYSLIAPLLSFYFTIEDPSERDMFRRLNPDLDHYLREFVWDSISGDPVLDELLAEYFSLPRGSRVRSDYLEAHPEINEYFEQNNDEADTAIQELLEYYFALSPGAERKQFAAEHPEIREYFDQLKLERDEFNQQLAAFDEADPRTREIRAKAQAEIEYAAWLQKYLLAMQKFAKLQPRGLEQRGRSGRRPTENEGEFIRERSQWLGAGVG